MDKKALRREIGEKKRAMAAEEIDAASVRLALRLFETAAYRRAGALYAYVAFNQEVRTRPIIERAWADGKRVAVPKLVGGEMRFIWLDDFGAGYSSFNVLKDFDFDVLKIDMTFLKGFEKNEKSGQKERHSVFIVQIWDF